MSNPILTALRERRSIRSYTDRAITREEITAMLEAGRWAPSGKNNQPFRFIVIHNDDTRLPALAECTAYSHIVTSAPVIIGVFLDKNSLYHELKDHQSAGGCIQNIMLAAHSLGLGSVWLGQMMNNAEQVLDVLGLDSNHYEFITCIAIGEPAQKGKSSRKPLEELMLEQY
ncbi:MAG: nitroreductase family protein [Desulfovibrionales bacterium]|nr:nitroreductase family protein [Desulfovibrionales bacterium]